MADISEINKKSLRFSFYDGIFGSGMIGFTQAYFTPFILLLGGTAGYVGALSALPNLCASMIQLKSPTFTALMKFRKKTVTIFVFLQALMLLPVVFIGLFEYRSPVFFIFCVILFTSFGALSVPPWGSMMADIVPENRRGDYFGWRARILGFVNVGSMFLAGYILHEIEKINVYSAFAVIFFCAMVFRMLSGYFIGKMHEPPFEHHIPEKTNLVEFLKKLHGNNFVRFLIYVFCMVFSVQIAAPFFAVIMIKDLKFNYFMYTILTIAESLTFFCLIHRWGRHADKVGNLKIIKFTGKLMGIIPVLWFFSHNFFWLVFAQMFSGFCWAGFNLCVSNFIYDSAPHKKRTRYISYYNFVNGIAICAGAQLGGFLLNVLPPFLGYKILSLFLISAVLRIIVGFFMPQKLKEVKNVSLISSDKLFFSIIGIKPLVRIRERQYWYY